MSDSSRHTGDLRDLDPKTAPRHLLTGIDALDRLLGGGIPFGSVVLFTASPASPSEVLLAEFLTGHDALYITTERPESTVRTALTDMEAMHEDMLICEVDHSNPLEDVADMIKDSHAELLAIDPIGIFEQAPDERYRQFLRKIANWADETDAAVLLHGLEGRGVTDRRDLTEYLADGVFRLQTNISGERVVNSLAIPKFRGGQAVEDVIKLDLTGDVDVDISRKIA